jgi:hypothetical protein
MDGTLERWLSPHQKNTYYPDKRVETLTLEGVKTVHHPDGSIEISYPHGVKVHKNPEGQSTWTYPSGLTFHTNTNRYEYHPPRAPNSAQAPGDYSYSDGTREILLPLGTILRHNPTEKYTAVIGPTCEVNAIHAEGIRHTIYPDGKQIILFPNGWIGKLTHQDQSPETWEWQYVSILNTLPQDVKVRFKISQGSRNTYILTLYAGSEPQIRWKHENGQAMVLHADGHFEMSSSATSTKRKQPEASAEEVEEPPRKRQKSSETAN